ncbi:MAG: ABC transporter substrate-binding protein [Actinomycetota bacterium]
MKSTLLKLLVALFALSLIAAACGDDDDTADSGDSDALADAEAALAAAEEAKEAAEAEAAEAQAAAEAAAAEAAEAAAEAAGEEVNPLAGTAVRITGPVRSPNEVAGLQGALDIFAEENGMTIFYVGSADWESEINVQIEAGTPPDISIFPQPGKLADFARDGFIVPLPDEVTESVSQNWSDGAMGFGNVDGTQYGVPDKTDLKSIVWYQPALFAANGYEVPTTLDELFALAETMIADGNTPFCIGIESGTATGWTFTDWVEDMMLRRHSGDTYDAWTSGELLFSSPEVSGVMQEVLDVWNTPGMVFAQGGTIASTSFRDNGEPLINGDCMMHRQASFFSAFFPDGTPVQDGSEGAIDVFQFPQGDTDPAIVLTAGTLVGAFVDTPEVMAVMEFFGSPEFANARQTLQKEALGGGDVLSGFNTANLNVDRSLWNPLEQSFLEIMATNDVRFDGSDLMPADVGAGTFWSEGTALVNGEKTVAEAVVVIDESWPR